MRCVRSVPGCWTHGQAWSDGQQAGRTVYTLDGRTVSAADGKVFEQRDGKQTCAAVHAGYHKRFSDASGVCPGLAHAALVGRTVRWPHGLPWPGGQSWRSLCEAGVLLCTLDIINTPQTLPWLSCDVCSSRMRTLRCAPLAARLPWSGGQRACRGLVLAVWRCVFPQQEGTPP